jgi:hypothetical protein
MRKLLWTLSMAAVCATPPAARAQLPVEANTPQPRPATPRVEGGFDPGGRQPTDIPTVPRIPPEALRPGILPFNPSSLPQSPYQPPERVELPSWLIPLILSILSAAGAAGGCCRGKSTGGK